MATTNRERYLKHREYYLSKSKEYYQLHKEEVRKKQKKYYTEHIEYYRSYSRGRWNEIKGIEAEKRNIFNSLSQDEQITEMLKFVKDERARLEANERGV